MINCALHITIVLSQYMSKFENKTLLLLRKTVVQYDRCPDKKGRFGINMHEGLCEVMKDSSIYKPRKRPQRCQMHQHLVLDI